MASLRRRGERSLENKWGQAPFCKKEDILIQKMGPGPIYSLGQKQRVFLPYSLSLSSMVATAISQNLFLIAEMEILTPPKQNLIFELRILIIFIEYILTFNGDLPSVKNF